VVGAIYGFPPSDLMTWASSAALLLAVTAMFRLERDNPLFLTALSSLCYASSLDLPRRALGTLESPIL